MENKLTIELDVRISRESADKLYAVAKAAADFAEALAALADSKEQNDIKALATEIADLVKAER